MNTRPTLETPRRLLAAAMLCALLLTQALGLLHRVQHVPGSARSSQAQLAAVLAAPEQRSLERLFAQHDDARDCQLFDPLTQAHAPGFAIVAATTAPVAERLQTASTTPDLAARVAGNQARGPPAQA